MKDNQAPSTLAFWVRYDYDSIFTKRIRYPISMYTQRCVFASLISSTLQVFCYLSNSRYQLAIRDKISSKIHQASFQLLVTLLFEEIKERRYKITIRTRAVIVRMLAHPTRAIMRQPKTNEKVKEFQLFRCVFPCTLCVLLLFSVLQNGIVIISESKRIMYHRRTKFDSFFKFFRRQKT